jgi:hypothetical protein
LSDAGPICSCPACGFDFRATPKIKAVFPNDEIEDLFRSMLLSLMKPTERSSRFDSGFFLVLHQFCHIMRSRSNANHLREFVLNRLGMKATEIELGRDPIEHQRIEERHEILVCALWLIAEPEERLRQAWEAKAVRYNVMCKDLNGVPKWYRSLTERFSDFRKGYRSASKIAKKVPMCLTALATPRWHQGSDSA